jgi:PadR family transcriptional regulator, regulatory protein PadR
MPKINPGPDFLPGTLEMLILKTLSRGANHGWGIAQHIQQVSEDALKVGEGSLYPALQRLLLNDFVEAEWGVTENNRRARYYRITGTGRKKLAEEQRSFAFLLAGIARVMEGA